MARDVRGIMRERAQGKGILVGFLALLQQLSYEIAAANVVHQIAEFHTAKWIVAEVLDYRSAIRVAVCLFELVFGKGWKSLEKKRSELIGPYEIHDLLVCENRVRERNACK
jgi:hypothetical protein